MRSAPARASRRSPAPLTPLCFARLSERGRERRECRLELGAKPGDDWNDRQRDAGRDQSIFDRGRGALVFQEPDDQTHRSALCNASDFLDLKSYWMLKTRTQFARPAMCRT